MMDFSGAAGQASDFDILPNGQLAWAVLNVRALKNSSGGSQYLDVELTIDQGQPFAGRKLWDKIGNPFFEGNSEKYRQMGMLAITRILEAGRGAGPNNQAGYQLDDFQQLNGLRVPIKVGIEQGTEGHDDKNRVSEWLTPNPASQSGHKHFVTLQSGVYNASANKTQAAPPANGFGGAPAASGNGSQTGGFGNGAPAQQQQSGFGNTGSGFQRPPADSSGQSGANDATTAASQTPTGVGASPSNGTSGNWLEQANGGAQAQR